MAFILSPYNATLNLADCDNRKLFENGCKWLKSKDAFDRQKGKYTKFFKLIGKEFEDTCVMCAFNIATIWSAVRRSPRQEDIVYIFQSCRLQKELIVPHIDRVWANTSFGNLTSECLAISDPMPTECVKLNVLSNLSKLKHIIMKKKI